MSNLPTTAAAQPLRQVGSVRELLVNNQAKQQLQAVAASHMKPERMMRLIANAIRATPKLAECQPMSLLGALMQCASLGLEPNTVLGHAYLIPFDKKGKNEKTGRWEVIETNVQLIIGYKGYIDLARRSGHITSIAAGIHYSDDNDTGGLWDYEEGTESRLRHRNGAMAGAKEHAYAIAKFKDGGHAYVVLPWAKVMKIRDGSQGWKSAEETARKYNKPINSPWFTHEDEMAMKTAIRALSKLLPLSVEFRDAVEADGGRANYDAYAMNPVAGLDVTPEEDVPAIEHDPETGEVIDTPIAEEEKEPARTVEPPKRAPRAKRDGTPYAGAESSSEEPAKADVSQYQSILDRITGDLLDGADAQELVDGFRPEIEKMKEDAPEIYDALKEEIAGYAPDQPNLI